MLTYLSALLAPGLACLGDWDQQRGFNTQYLSSMTIITAVTKGDEIAIACDTQTSHGALKYTADYKVNHIKLIPFGHSFFGLTGAVAISQIFEDLLSKLEPEPLASRSEIFRWLLSHQEKLKTEYFLKADSSNDKNQPAESIGLVALLANPHGIFSISHYREVMEFTKFWAVGSGMTYALGAMDILYEQDLTASEIAEQAALTATKFNTGCAPPVHVECMKKATVAKRKRSSKKKKA